MSLFGASIGGSALGRVLVEVGLDARPLEAGMAQTKGSVAKGATGIGSTFKTAVKAGAILAGAAVIKFGADSVKAFIASEEAGQRLGNSLKNNAKLSDVSTQSWQDQAHALQELTGIQDVEITSAQAMLGQFDLTGTQVQALIPLVVDLSQKMGIDLSTAVKAVGKATAGNTGSLQRFGIIVDKGKDGIAGFGDVVSALQGKVGGFSQSISGNFQTRMKVLAANFKDVEQTVGQALIPVLQGLASALNTLMPLISLAASNWKLLLLSFLAFKAVRGISAIFAGLNFALNGLGTATTRAGRGVQGVAGFLAKYPGIATAAAVAIPLIGAALDALGQASREAQIRVQALFDALSTGGESEKTLRARMMEVAPIIEQQSGGLIKVSDVLSAFNTDLATAKDRLHQKAAADRAATRTSLDLFGGLQSVFTAAGAAATQDERAAFAAEHLATAQKKAAAAAHAQYIAELSLAGGLLGLEGNAIQAGQAHDSLAAAQKKVAQMQAAGKTSGEAYKQALADENQAALDATTSQLGLVQAVQDYIKSNDGSKASTSQAIELIRQYGRENGLTAGEVANLIGEVTGLVKQYGQVPASVHTDVLAAGLAGNLTDLARYNQYLATLDGKQVFVTVHTSFVNTGSAPHGGIQGSTTTSGP